MSKVSSRTHTANAFQVRIVQSGLLAGVSGEQDVANATLWSGTRLQAASWTLQQEGVC